MKGNSLRLILDPLVGAAICLAAILPLGAAGRPSPVIEQFEARAVSVSGTEDTGRIGIYIERWSSNDDVERVRAALAKGDPDMLLLALQQPRGRVGVVLMPGVQAHGARTRIRTPKNLLFAQQILTPSGRRVIVASDEHLGLGESQIDARREIYEFNVMEIRFGPDGAGVAKVASADEVIYNPVTKSLELRNFATRPNRLIDVRADNSAVRTKADGVLAAKSGK